MKLSKNLITFQIVRCIRTIKCVKVRALFGKLVLGPRHTYIVALVLTVLSRMMCVLHVRNDYATYNMA